MTNRPVAIRPERSLTPSEALYVARLDSAGVFVAPEDADLRAAREASWPAADRLARLGGGWGSQAPKLVVVGDRPKHPGQPAFFSRGGNFLLRALRILDHDELTIYLTNCRTRTGKRKDTRLRAQLDALARYEPVVVAAGREAEAALIRIGFQGFHQIPHPSARHILSAQGGAQGYAVKLTQLGVPKGSLVRAFAEVPELARLPKPYDALSVASRQGPSATAAEDTVGRGVRNRIDVSDAKAQAARRLYVIGEASSVAEAARTVGVSESSCRQIARREGWQAERAEFAREATERAKQGALRAEARAWANSRRLAWAGTERALGDLVRRLRLPPGDEDRLTPTPHQAESLARTALALSQANLAEDNSDRDRLESLPLAELARQVAATAEALGGGKPKKGGEQ
jgi:hypothetical protein